MVKIAYPHMELVLKDRLFHVRSVSCGFKIMLNKKGSSGRNSGTNPNFCYLRLSNRHATASTPVPANKPSNPVVDGVVVGAGVDCVSGAKRRIWY